MDFHRVTDGRRVAKTKRLLRTHLLAIRCWKSARPKKVSQQSYWRKPKSFRAEQGSPAEPPLFLGGMRRAQLESLTDRSAATVAVTRGFSHMKQSSQSRIVHVSWTDKSRISAVPFVERLSSLSLPFR